MRKPLHPANLATNLPAGVAVPRYDRAVLRSGIVHLGIGAFMRGHLAVANEAALHASGDLRWGITGVSLRQPDTRDALGPQQGLYTVAIRDAGADRRPRQRLQVIGGVREVLVAPQQPQAVLERLAHADTRIVSLTITEKAYVPEPPGGGADGRASGEGAPRTAAGWLLAALALRRERALPGVTLMSLDNLPSNGERLQALVQEQARGHAGGAALADWIGRTCSFPNSMVDRIVPRTTAADREAVAAALGLDDAWPVVGEPFFDWAVEDRFVAGRPDWSAGGARFVASAAPWEQLKLRMVNGAHSVIAYLGAMAGWETVFDAVAQPALARHVEALLREEIEPTLPALPGLDLAGYRAQLMARWRNPAIAHRTQQIAMDGSQKIPQRWIAPLRERFARGQPVQRLALGVAAWLHYLRGTDEAGRAYAIDDPQAGTLASLRSQGDGALLGFAPVFGELAGDARLAAAVAPHLASLRQRGVRATLEALP